MKSEYCWLCGRDFRCELFYAQSGGELIRFRDFAPLPDGVVGHPRGLEWFCRTHAPAARDLSHLDSASALTELQRQFGRFPERVEYLPMPEPSLWVTKVGPHPARVLAVIQQATGRRATEALTVLKSVPFELVRGSPQSFEGWRRSLESAEAGVEIRYE